MPTYNPLEVTQEDLQQWKKDRLPFCLIDVREKEEREEGHIGGELIPLSELLNHLDKIPSHTTVLYCRSGRRSLMAAQKLREVLRRQDIFSLAGGMLAATSVNS